MAVAQAFKLCIGAFAQSSTGTAYSELVEADYKALKWGTTSIIPIDYKFTNFTLNAATTETTDTPLITDLTKYARYQSGRTTPGTATFAHLRPADVASIYDTLDALDVEDNRLCLLTAGIYNSETQGTRSYDVFFATCALLTEDGSVTGEAGQNFTSTLTFQPTGMPLRGIAKCGATLSWNTSTGAITFQETP